MQPVGAIPRNSTAARAKRQDFWAEVVIGAVAVLRAASVQCQRRESPWRAARSRGHAPRVRTDGRGAGGPRGPPARPPERAPPPRRREPPRAVVRGEVLLDPR